MHVPAYFADEGLRYNNLAPGNGGGIYVNQYTLIWDILWPSAGDIATGVFAFSNTTNANANPSDMRADLVNKRLGFYRGSTVETADNVFQLDHWHRIAFTVDTALGTDNGRVYVDGTLVYDGPINDSTDVGYSLYSTTDGDPLPDRLAYSHMCPSSDGITAEAYVNSFYFIDRALSPARIAALGGPRASGITSGGTPPCVADFDDGTGTGTPDGGVTIDDLLYYLSIFESGVAAADVNDGTGTNTCDGGVTIDDLLYYLFRFEAGC